MYAVIGALAFVCALLGAGGQVIADASLGAQIFVGVVAALSIVSIAKSLRE